MFNEKVSEDMNPTILNQSGPFLNEYISYDQSTFLTIKTYFMSDPTI